MNGVCVRWRGWLDLERLDGVGCLEYNEERAAQEDALLREQIDRYNQRLKEFEDKQRGYRPPDHHRTSAAAAAEQDLEVRHHHLHHSAAAGVGPSPLQRQYMKLF
ncbi:unnamed protein product [Acanthoscelides obtectus]|uniref:Protein big brother n=1 Tax=Acanthoscelides obtectus TaxID=200917 RepID=A0A9P0KCL3_ACAOB|nr:unnamed protein product [Acanthoscelides obtectus]CAK1630707.1 Protein big brother [Acanthoscelides obtectus]